MIFLSVLLGSVASTAFLFAVQMNEEQRWAQNMNPGVNKTSSSLNQKPKARVYGLSALVGVGLVAAANNYDPVLLLGGAAAGPLVMWMRFCDQRAKRQSDLMAQLPDFLDLLALGMSVGLNIEQAWLLSVRHIKPGFLKADLQFICRSLSMGHPSEEAFQQLARRVGDNRISMTLALLSQSLKRGNPIQTVLHDQAAAARRARLMMAEKRAQTAGLRLLLPMFVFIFPTLFLVLFAPLVIRSLQGASLF